MATAASLVSLACAFVPDHASAQDAPDLAVVSAALASDDEVDRREAIHTLQTLPATALPAIAERLARLRRARPTREEAEGALTAFRRATGSRRADDLVDLAAGVETVVASQRDRATLAMAEPLLLLRSLEAQGSVAALRLVPAVLGLDGEPWRMEGRRVTIRLGDRAAAAAILARSDESSAEGRVWARWTTERLELDNPGALAQRLGPGELADVLRAYGETHTLSAIPVVASFVDADQRRLREAAREALRAYRQNGIWVARETFETRLGEEPDLRWGWERTLDELYGRLDANRAAHVHAALAEASAALERGEPLAARRLLDAALVQSPELASVEAAELYAAIASRTTAPASSELLRRALAISPDSTHAPSWRGRLVHADATSALASGVLDANAFSRAAELAPDCGDCMAAQATIAAQTAAPANDRTVPLAMAAGLFAVLGLLLLAWPRERPEPPSSEQDDGMATSPGLVPADDTLG